MQRSMMQVFVKGSIEAVKLYKTAFDADVLCTYAAENGGYMHSELNAHGQIIAVSEIAEDVIVGNTMMFCFHFGPGGERNVRKAYAAPAAALLRSFQSPDSVFPASHSWAAPSLGSRI